MPRIVSTLEFAKASKDRAWQMMTRIYEQLARVVNGGVNVGNGWNAAMPAANTANPDNPDNMRGALVLVTFAAANTDTLIHHNLGWIPRCYIPLWKSAPCDVYDGAGIGQNLQPAATTTAGTNPATTATTQTIPLRGSAAATVLLWIF